ncbi:MAG: hypothetical protein AB7T74_02300 [Clostridia bacterium]
MIIAKDTYLVKARMNLGNFFDAPDADVFIELREPDTKATFKLNNAFTSGDNERIVITFVELLPALITAHNLMKTETESYTLTEVAGIIESKLDLFLHVLDQYKEKVIFTLGKKSGGK